MRSEVEEIRSKVCEAIDLLGEAGSMVDALAGDAQHTIDATKRTCGAHGVIEAAERWDYEQEKIMDAMYKLNNIVF